MPSIALPATASTADHLSTNAAAPAAPQLQFRISTSLTDVTGHSNSQNGNHAREWYKVTPFLAVLTKDSKRPKPTQNKKRKRCFDEENSRKEQPVSLMAYLAAKEAVVPASVVLRNLLDAGP